MLLLRWKQPKKGPSFSSSAAEAHLEAGIGKQEAGSGNAIEALKRCGLKKSLREGRGIHSHIIIRDGRNPSSFLANCLVQMYGLCGSTRDAKNTFDRIMDPDNVSRTLLIKAYAQNGEVLEAEDVFNKMPSPDVIAWNTMIGAYAQNGGAREAVNLFTKMQASGPHPSNVTMICVLDACIDMQMGYRVHNSIIEFHFEDDTIVGNALITMYGRCGEANEAEHVFMAMRGKNVVTWSALISVFVRNGEDRKALQMFHEMMVSNLRPNHITCISILDACANLSDLVEGRKVLSMIIECGYEKNLPVGNALVDMFGKCYSLLDARNWFSKLDRANVVTWSALMGSYAQNGSFKEVLHLFNQMQGYGIKPDRVTFLSVLDACGNLGILEVGQAVHSLIIENGYGSELILGNSLINFYGKCGHPINAKSVFYNLPATNVVSWSTVIIVCAQSGNEKEAISLYCQMQATGVKPNVVTLVSILEACQNLNEGLILHHTMVSDGYDEDTSVGTALINMYSKFFSFHSAKKTFHRITRQDVVSWTALLAASRHLEHDREALDLFYEMQLGGFHPNNVTFIHMLDACAGLAAYEEGKEVHNAVLNYNHDDGDDDDDEVVSNALMNMYGKCGSFYDAITQFSCMERRDGVSWNTILSACAQNGCTREAMDLFKQMGSQEIEPNEATFVSILTACSHGGLIDEALQYFVCLSASYAPLVNEEHLACLTDLYGRAGQLIVAEQLTKSIPCERALSALSSLLGACKAHGDIARGLSTVMNMLHLNPERASCYVDLANLLVLQHDG